MSDTTLTGHHSKAAEHQGRAQHHHEQAAKRHEEGDLARPIITRMLRTGTTFRPSITKRKRPSTAPIITQNTKADQSMERRRRDHLRGWR